MNNTQTFSWGVISGALVASIIWIICVIDVSEESYCRGQIDALSGNKIQYELRSNPDGTVTWEKIDKEDNRE